MCTEIYLKRPLQSVGAYVVEDGGEGRLVCFGGYNEEEGRVADGEMFEIGTNLMSKGNFKLCEKMCCYGSMYRVENTIFGWVFTD